MPTTWRIQPRRRRAAVAGRARAGSTRAGSAGRGSPRPDAETTWAPLKRQGASTTAWRTGKPSTT